MTTTPVLPTRERRCAAGLELREEGAKDGSIATLVGYAAVYNTLSVDLGGFRELIRPGAFKRSLDRGDDVRAFAHHSSPMIVGRRSAGTLVIAEDDKGLRTEIKVPDTTAGRDLVVSVKRGDLTGMSFEFRKIKDEWSKLNKDGDNVYRRELIDVDLYEVSVVTWPAYLDTNVEARSLEALLRDGITRAGKDALPAGPFDVAARAKRDRIVQLHRARVAVWNRS